MDTVIIDSTPAAVAEFSTDVTFCDRDTFGELLESISPSSASNASVELDDQHNDLYRDLLQQSGGGATYSAPCSPAPCSPSNTNADDVADDVAALNVESQSPFALDTLSAVAASAQHAPEPEHEREPEPECEPNTLYLPWTDEDQAEYEAAQDALYAAHAELVRAQAALDAESREPEPEPEPASEPVAVATPLGPPPAWGVSLAAAADAARVNFVAARDAAAAAAAARVRRSPHGIPVPASLPRFQLPERAAVTYGLPRALPAFDAVPIEHTAEPAPVPVPVVEPTVRVRKQPRAPRVRKPAPVRAPAPAVAAAAPAACTDDPISAAGRTLILQTNTVLVVELGRPQRPVVFYDHGHNTASLHRTPGGDYEVRADADDMGDTDLSQLERARFACIRLNGSAKLTFRFYNETLTDAQIKLDARLKPSHYTLEARVELFALMLTGDTLALQLCGNSRLSHLPPMPADVALLATLRTEAVLTGAEHCIVSDATFHLYGSTRVESVHCTHAITVHSRSVGVHMDCSREENVRPTRLSRREVNKGIILRRIKKLATLSSRDAEHAAKLAAADDDSSSSSSSSSSPAPCAEPEPEPEHAPLRITIMRPVHSQQQAPRLDSKRRRVAAPAHVHERSPVHVPAAVASPDNFACSQCHVERASVLLAPCMHMVCCLACMQQCDASQYAAELPSACPRCRATVLHQLVIKTPKTHANTTNLIVLDDDDSNSASYE